jgi:SAM-dependent methyltransferase
VLEATFGRFVPAFIRRRLMVVETRIEQELRAFAEPLDPSKMLLDAGCGEGRHRRLFSNARYFGVDLAIGDEAWNYSDVDAVANLSSLPFRENVFDAAINVVVLEHTRDPAEVIRELARVLRPGGRLLLIAPHAWEVHQSPHDFFRFTRHGLALLFDRANLRTLRIEPVGGYFTLLARRLMNSIGFFQGGLRWLAFPFVAVVALICGLVLPLFDRLDAERNFTLAYVCVVEKG